MDPGTSTASQVDRQSRTNSIGCHCPEIPGSDQAPHKVVHESTEASRHTDMGRWEKAHYYLGKHYNKILDSEKAKPLGKEAQI